jgi:Domain of unknown function (DUF4375)
MSENFEPGQVYWKVIDPIFEHVSFYDAFEIFQRDFANISDKQKILLATHWANSEICNGGFLQFFSNSTGMLAPEAVIGFRAIGLINCAELVHEACLMLGLPYPRARAECNKRIDDFTSMNVKGDYVFDDKDTRYFTLIDTENGGFDVAADKYALVN